MKKSPPPVLPRNRSEWGKWLLAAGLLLVFILGLLELYPVQNFLFPGKYHTIKLNLIRKECWKIQGGLASLQAQIDNLTRLKGQPGQGDLINSSQASANPASPRAEVPESSWPSLIHAAKKKRVYVARKLNYVGRVLNSMQRSLKPPQSDNGGASPLKAASANPLQQIQEIQTRLQTYNDRLHDLSKKLGKLTESSPSPSTRTITDIKGK
jgi:hypothetical protein